MKPISKSLLFGTLVLAAFFAGSALRRPANADITTDVATRIYSVGFDEWVLVYTSAMFGTSNPDYNVSVVRDVKDNGVRFHVVGNYANTPAGLRWYQVHSPKIREKIDALCRNWTAYGYKISVNDFDFSFQKGG